MAIEGQVQDSSISTSVKNQIVLSVDTNPTPTQAKWQWDDGSYMLWDNNSYILLD